MLLGYVARESLRFRLQGFRLLWRAVPSASANKMISYSPSYVKFGLQRPATPLIQRFYPLTYQKVWALPLSLVTTYGIVELFSLPKGTEIFHFPSFALSSLCIQEEILRHDS